MGKPEKPAEVPSTPDLALPIEEERLFHEINLLRLEGYYFCLDPKAAKRQRAKREFVERIKAPEDVLESPITIEPNPNYGYPSIVAYKVLQAIMKKLSEYGYPVSESVAFSQRELGKLIGRQSFGGKDSRELFLAARQLNTTSVWCSLYDKETKAWKVATFYIVESCLFSGKKNQISQCVFKINPLIVKSLNNRYSFLINSARIDRLEPITTALYKHLFYHFSNIYGHAKDRGFVFHKDYADICTQWLGGLTILKHKSKILGEQLGQHIKILKERRLISAFSLEKRTEDGFTFTFSPGRSFFEDYARFYGGHAELPFARAADRRRLEQPMELVRYFYKKLYQMEDMDDLIFSDKEVEFAASLLEKHAFEELANFVDYGVHEIRNISYDVKTFLGLKPHYPAFLAKLQTLTADKARAREQQVTQANRDLEDRYRAFRKQQLEAARHGTTAETLAEFERAAKEQVATAHPNNIAANILVRLHVENQLAQKFHIPTLEQWKAKHLAS